MSIQIRPGLNKNLLLDHFSADENKIVKRLGIEWYVTHSGGEFTLGINSTYRYFLMKPTDMYKEMFNLDREIVVIFSPFENFEPRTLDAIDYAAHQYQSMRLERVCSIIISKDPLVEQKLREILKNDKESQVVIPFTYDELLTNHDDYFIRNRFKKHFYSRDLFAFEGPLKSDLYFFGRNDLIHSIANRHKSNENSALFGLRKTGKTSVIFGAQRALTKMDAITVFIDCQNPAFHRRRWNKALFYIISEMKHQLKIEIGIKSEEKYSEEEAPLIFEKELIKVFELLDKRNILFIFDEIENISFGISPSEHWMKGYDFIFFWQTLRSLYQKLPNVFSYLIVGTNSTCVETPTINGKDNPIFNQVPFSYIEGFDVPQTREMIRKLDRLMGLNFDEIIYSKLTEDFGGHPFLIRHVCSVINKISPQDRPVYVDRTIYETAKKRFNEEYSNYIEMILTVLKEFYNDEYEMLKYLAVGDIETFKEFAAMSPYYTNHLLGYGIIETHNSNYCFKIDIVKEYLIKQHKFRKINLTQTEMWQEVSERRNIIESRLRIIIRNQMKAVFGKSEARGKILAILGDPRKTKYTGYTYEELFDLNKTELYFEDLRKIIIKNWEIFKNIFSGQQDFDAKMQTINKYRIDAHAKEIDSNDFEYLRASLTSIENQLTEYLT